MTRTATSRRWVIHLDMDSFYASVEQLTRPTLRARPVLVGGLGPRAVVAGASYEARAYGPHSAMPMSQARRLLPPTGVVLPARFRLYEEMSRRVFAIVAEHAPVLEHVSLDEAFAEPPNLADVGPAQVESSATALRSRIAQETGLIASVGAGSGKQVAKIASAQAKPDGLIVVPQGTEQEFLADLPVRALWGIGPVAEAKLRGLGVVTIGQFAALREADVASLLGSSVGRDLHRLATGVDERPVAERGEAKQVSAETTFDEDVVELATLRSHVRTVAHNAHTRLTHSNRAARTVTIKLRRADMSVVSRSDTSPYPSDDLAELVAMAERLLPDPTQFGPIRLAGVAFSGLTETHQESLFTVAGGTRTAAVTETTPAPRRSRTGWRPGDDVVHERFGHGWIQGAGRGRVTVRFETRTSGPGVARTFAGDDVELSATDPLGSLA